MVSSQEKSPTSLCPFSVQVQHSSRDGDDGFKGRLQIGGRMITNLCYADDIICCRPLQRQWVLNKAGVRKKLLQTVKAKKLTYYGHTMTKQGSSPEKDIMQRTMPHAHRCRRPRTAWIVQIKTWTGLTMQE